MGEIELCTCGHPKAPFHNYPTIIGCGFVKDEKFKILDHTVYVDEQIPVTL